MFVVVRFDQEKQYIEDFLQLPQKLYTKKTLVQNEEEERKLLTGTHVFSKYFHMAKFLVYEDEERADTVCARCTVTIYEADGCAYIGYFECIDHRACARVLFEAAHQFAKEAGCQTILGPVDGSFWIRYRMKVNKFGQNPYISEPYNREYYQDLFLDNGYEVQESYVSNSYKKLPLFYNGVKKYRDRYRLFREKGYIICSPKRKEWDQVIGEVYRMIMELYSDFPIFKYVEEEDFVAYFKSFRMITDMSMVKLAYYQGEAVGFFIGLPDYSNRLYGKIGLLTILRILMQRVRSRNYVMLYMGVKPGHVGLGRAMVYTMMKEVQKKRCTSIGALIKVGKVSGNYVEDDIESKYKYVLLGRELSR